MGDVQTLPIPTIPNVQMPSEKADIIEKIRPDIIVDTLMHSLMGEEKVNGKWIKIPEVQDRALSRKAAFDIANIMLSASSQNVSISKVDDADIRVRTKDTVLAALIKCLRNWKEYGIKGSDQIYSIKTIVINNTFFTLKQPEGGGIQKVITGTTQEHRLVNSEEKQSGVLGSLIRR